MNVNYTEKEKVLTLKQIRPIACQSEVFRFQTFSFRLHSFNRDRRAEKDKTDYCEASDTE